MGIAGGEPKKLPEVAIFQSRIIQVNFLCFQVTVDNQLHA